MSHESEQWCWPIAPRFGRIGLRLLGFATLLLLSPFAQFSAAEEGTNPALRVGAILPLSGTSAIWGRHLQHGIELARETYLPDKQIWIEDDHLDAAAALTAYRQLRERRGINLVILFGSQAGHAVIPLAERDGVFTLLITSDPRPVIGARHALRFALSSDSQARLLLSYLRKRRFSSVALLSSTHEAMLQYMTAFSALAPDYGVNVVFQEDYPRGESDFRTRLARIKERKPVAVINSFLPGSLSSFTQQLRQLMPTLPAFAFAQAENLDEVKAAKGSMDGLIFTAAKISKEFSESYRRRYNEDAHTFSAYSYDLVALLAKIAHEPKGETADEIGAKIRALGGFSGACGELRLGADNAFEFEPRLLQVQGDEFVEVSAQQ